MTDDDIKAWVRNEIERAQLQVRIDTCQAAIQALKAELVLLQDAMRELEQH